MNRRTFLRTGAGLAGSAVAIAGSSCGSSRRRLNVFNWDAYVAPTTIPDFEREFSCKVRYATYGSAEEMLARVMAGNSGWDVVFPSNSFVRPMHELDLLEPIDQGRLKLLGNLDKHFRSPEWDPGLEWCVPYMYSSTGILYSKKVSRPPKAWADLWTDSYSRRTTMLDDPAEVFGACLKVMGDSVNATDDGQLKSARDLAIRQKPLLRAYLNEEVRDQVVAAVLAGVKTTTTGLMLAYEREGRPLPTAGGRFAAVDSAGMPVAVIEMTEVRVVRIGDIDLRHVLDDGDESIADWRAAHEEYWHSAELRRIIAEPEFVVDDDTEVLAQRFRLVHAVVASTKSE